MVVGAGESGQPPAGDRIAVEILLQAAEMREAADGLHYRKHFPEAKTFPCNVPGCDKVGENGFYRRDKLIHHRRTAHPIRLLETRLLVEASWAGSGRVCCRQSGCSILSDRRLAHFRSATAEKALVKLLSGLDQV